MAAEMQWLYPFSQINLIIGENNLGKSNLLLFVAERYQKAVEAASREAMSVFDNDDLNRNIENSIVSFGLPMQFIKPHISDHDADAAGFLDKLLSDLNRRPEDYRVRFLEDLGQSKQLQALRFDETSIPSLTSLLTFDEWRRLSSALTGYSSDSLMYNVDKVMGQLFNFSKLWIKGDPLLISAKRECNRLPNESMIRRDNTVYFDGNGLTSLIAEYKRSSKNADQMRKVFRRLERFVQHVMSHSGVTLEVPIGADILQVVLNDSITWRLEELGTGVHEIILLAAACTLHSSRVICIEEPEVHVHPKWQRRFVELLSETDNQYFIATHSAHIMDLPGVSVFHLTGTPEGTKVRQAVTAAHKVEVCASLGYRPSDLMQTNCVIWVEGPTDRTYLNNWLAMVAPALVEGVHYSIMFYGGSLRTYLTAMDLTEDTSDGEKVVFPRQVMDLIELRKINQNLAIVMDSDKHKASDELKPVVQELDQQFKGTPGFAWVTAGRAIENYFAENDVLEAMRVVHPRSQFAQDEGTDQFRLLATLVAKTKEGKETKYAAKKTEIAEQLIKSGAKVRDDLDWNEQMAKLVEFIERANRA